jgi:hypothetical protein
VKDIFLDNGLGEKHEEKIWSNDDFQSQLLKKHGEAEAQLAS